METSEKGRSTRNTRAAAVVKETGNPFWQAARPRASAAAAALFREAGYEGAKIETIAAQAEVSIGTIYNYYQNKGDILGAIVSMEVNEVLNAGRGVVASPPANVGDALDTLLGIYIEHSLHYLSKEMWRQAMAISTQLPDSPFGQAYTALDRALTEQIRALIARLQAMAWCAPTSTGSCLLYTSPSPRD